MPDGSGHMQPYLDQALDNASSLTGAGVDWIDALRRAGADAYGAHGLPHRADEYWRYTSLNALANEDFQLTSDAPAIGLPSLPHKLVSELSTYRVVVVNGRLRPDLCALGGLPDDVLISGLEHLMAAAPERLEPYLGKIVRLQDMPMAALDPKLAILDETDSGLDIDALKVVADGVNAMRSEERGLLVITHYQRLLDYIEPDHVHVLSDGKIIKSGDKSLALELEDKGYSWLDKTA